MINDFVKFMTGQSMRGFDFFLCFMLFGGCVTYGIRRLMLHPVSKLPLIIFTGVALGGGVWSVVPYFWYKLPPVSANWSSVYYGQLLREQYPHHLLNPAWFSYARLWPIAETCARFGLVTVVLAIIFFVSQRWVRILRDR